MEVLPAEAGRAAAPVRPETALVRDIRIPIPAHRSGQETLAEATARHTPGAALALMLAALVTGALASVPREAGRVATTLAPHRLELAAVAASCLLMALFLVGIRG